MGSFFLLETVSVCCFERLCTKYPPKKTGVFDSFYRKQLCCRVLKHQHRQNTILLVLEGRKGSPSVSHSITSQRGFLFKHGAKIFAMYEIY